MHEVTLHIIKSCQLCRSSLTYDWVMSRIWMSYVTHMNESCHTFEWVMSHIWMSHVTHMNESCLTYEWVMSHIWMSQVSHMNESCHAWMRPHMNEKSHMFMSHVTHAWVLSRMHESRQLWLNEGTIQEQMCYECVRTAGSSMSEICHYFLVPRQICGKRRDMHSND